MNCLSDVLERHREARITYLLQPSRTTLVNLNLAMLDVKAALDGITRSVLVEKYADVLGSETSK